MNEKAELGDVVKDKISGFQGVVTGIHKYLNGCTRLSVSPQTVKKDEKIPLDDVHLDSIQVEIVKKNVMESVKETVEGPRPDAPGMNT